MDGLLADAGMSRADVEYVHVPANNTLAAISTGDVDAIAVWEPWIAAAVANAGASLVARGGCSSCFETGITITTQKVIDEQPKTLKLYLLAFAEAQQWVRQNKDEAADITARWLPGTERNVIRAVLENAPLDMRISKNILVGLDQKTIAILYEQGKIKRKVLANDIVDPAFEVYLRSAAPHPASCRRGSLLRPAAGRVRAGDVLGEARQPPVLVRCAVEPRPARPRLIGNALAFPLGIAIARSRLASGLLQPVVIFMQSIAGIAWVPLAIIWFGLGIGSVLFVIVNTIFFANLYNVISGVRSIPPTLHRAVLSHGGRGWQIYRHLIIPGALLQVIVGLRTSMAYGWRALVAGEMIAGSRGIGFRTMEAMQWYQSDVVVLGMLVIGVLWLILDRILFVPLEAHTVRRWGLIQR